VNSRAALIAQMARARGLDPKAVLAIADVEGGFHGSIGDHGTSFGPFQEHAGGALPAAVWARGANYANQWANSRQGISYALNAMVKDGISGLHGRQAVSAISSKFERPANIPAEISKAMTRYGGSFGGSSAPLSSPTVGGVSAGGASGGNPYAEQIAAQLLQQGQGITQAQQPGQTMQATVTQNPGLLSDPSNLLAMAMQRNAMQASNVQMSPHGLLSVQGANGGAPEDMAAVKLAEHYLGTPYVYGGDKPGGFDCSGLLQFVWGKNGVHIPRTTYQQWGAGKAVNMKDLQPGDAVFYRGSDSIVQGGKVLPGHVAMYIGNGKVIQAPHTGADVQITPLSAMGPAMGARSFTG
jgi:cell wall-associated NlpC family hydrolase